MIRNERILAAMLVVCGGVFAEDAYIQGTGQQAILTDCCPGADLRVEVDYAFDEVENSMRTIGLETSSTGNAFHFLVAGTDLYFGIGNTWTGYRPNITADTARHTAILDAKGGALSFVTGGATVWTTGITNATTRTGTWPLAVFGANKAAASLVTYQPSGNYAKMKLYSLKVYENNAIAHYYKPWRSVDGAFTGLKDPCTGRCFVNCANARTQFLSGGEISDAPAWDLAETHNEDVSYQIV